MKTRGVPIGNATWIKQVENAVEVLHMEDIGITEKTV